MLFADTLDAYINKYSSLVSYLADNVTAGDVPPSGPAPPDLTSSAISLRVRRAFAFSKSEYCLTPATARHLLIKDWRRLRQRGRRP